MNARSKDSRPRPKSSSSPRSAMALKRRTVSVKLSAGTSISRASSATVSAARHRPADTYSLVGENDTLGAITGGCSPARLS